MRLSNGFFHDMNSITTTSARREHEARARGTSTSTRRGLAQERTGAGTSWSSAQLDAFALVQAPKVWTSSRRKARMCRRDHVVAAAWPLCVPQCPSNVVSPAVFDDVHEKFLDRQQNQR